MVEKSSLFESTSKPGSELAKKMTKVAPHHFEQFSNRLPNNGNALQQARNKLQSSNLDLNDQQVSQLNSLMNKFYSSGFTKLDLMAKANAPMLEVKSSTEKGMTFRLAGDDRDITIQEDGSLALFHSSGQTEPSDLFSNIDEFVETIHLTDVSLNNIDSSTLSYTEKLHFQSNGTQVECASDCEVSENNIDGTSQLHSKEGQKIILDHPKYNKLSINQIFAEPKPEEITVSDGNNIVRAYKDETGGYSSLNGARKGKRPYIYEGYEITNRDDKDKGFNGKREPAGGFQEGINYRREDGYNHRLDDLASTRGQNNQPPVLHLDYSLSDKSSLLSTVAYPQRENNQWKYHNADGDYIPVYDHTMITLQDTIDNKKEAREALENIDYSLNDLQDQLSDFDKHASLYEEYFKEYHGGRLGIENSSIQITNQSVQFTFDDAYANQRYNIDRQIELGAITNPNGSINNNLLQSAIANEISSIVREHKVTKEDVEVEEKTLNTEFAETCTPINMGKNSCGRSVRGILKKFGVKGIPEYGCNGCNRDDILSNGSREEKFSHNGRKIVFKEQYCKTPFDAPAGSIVVFGKDAQHPRASNARKKYGHVEVMCDEGKFNHYTRVNHAGGSASITKNEAASITRNECMKKTGFTGHAYIMEYIT